MKASRLKRKSPAFRQGYRTGYQEGVSMDNEQKKMAPGTDMESWREYCLRMRDQNTEEFLTGDIEGYRRGYADGRQQEEQERTDLTLAGVIITSVIAGAIGLTVGLVVA